MKIVRMSFPVVALGAILLSGCGAVKNAADELSNSLNIRGHWLMTQSEHNNAVERALENESVVLTFKDGRAAFSPTDSVRGRAVFALLSRCTAGPRPYTTEANDIVLAATADCPVKRVTVQRLDANSFKFADPDRPDVTRVFRRIDENRYNALVKASDRRP